MVAASRVLAALFWFVTAGYALLSAIPFAWTHFLKPGLVPALTLFAERHAWISLAVLAITAAGLHRWIRAGHRGVLAVIGLWLATLVWSFAGSGLAGLEPSALALAVSFAAVVPPVWLSLIDFGANGARSSAPDSTAPGDFAACCAAALIVTATHAAADGLVTRAWAGETAQSLVLHLLVFSAIFGAMSIARGVARFTPQPGAVEAWIGRAMVGALLALVLSRVVLASLSFSGPRGTVAAAIFGSALAIVIGPRGSSAPGGLMTALAGLTPRWAADSLPRTAGWVVLAMAGIAAAERAVAHTDWNFTVGKLLALMSWLVALAACLRVSAVRAGHPRWSRLPASVMPFAACVLVLGVYQFRDARVAAAAPGTAPAATTAVTNISARLLLDALAPPAVADDGLYEYLQRHTNIPHNVRVEPVPVEFAPLDRAPAQRPHIFMFVVDSLRRDYVAPYNARVTFTPAIQRFAAESAVFDRAFTRYGATGLSVPSIWVGGLVLHKQYVTPFAPMNTLARLTSAHGYAQWMSTDHIIETIVPPAPGRDPLDADRHVKDFRLCTTLQEVRSRLDRLTPSAPAFVYSLPQDVHVSALTREGAQPVDQGGYDGFNAAYASRVRRFDECFGAFVDDLKARGLYDQSIVVLTADHGDSLGEQGRMGHAYTIFPEIVQVPLIVHLPASLRAEFQADTRAVAFTSDITPSLYALLGHQPERPSPIFGRPLFRRAGDRPAARGGAEVVASSYGSVYGALLNDAKRLYIIDGVSLREHVFELDGSAAGVEIAVGAADREAGQRAIRDTVAEIARFYRYSADK